MIKKLLGGLLIVISTIFIMAMPANAATNATDPCLQALASNLIDTIDSKIDPGNDFITISSDNMVEFFTKNLDICRDYLLSRTSPDDDIEISDSAAGLVIDIHWDYLIEQVAAAATIDNQKRMLFVCENNRSYQAGIDTVMWVATIVAAVYSFGSGGVAIQGAKAAVVQGAKSLVKVGAKKGMKQAAIDATAKRLGVDIAGKTAAQKAAQVAAAEAAKKTAYNQAATAAKSAATKAANNAVVIQTKAALKSRGITRITDTAIKKEIQAQIAAGAKNTKDLTAALNLLDDKAAKAAAKRAAHKASVAEIASANADLAAATAALTAETAAASSALNAALAKFAISTPLAAAGGIASIYSFLESGFNPQIMNCTDTDAGEGCYVSCTKDPLNAPQDDLNTKVFKPIFGKNLCIDEESNYVLREIKSGMPVPGDIFVTTQDKWEKAKAEINSKVKDQGNCDWNEDDIDMYVATPLYDPSTLMPSGNGTVGLIIDGMRIDD